MKLSPIHSKAIGLLEVLNSHVIAQLSVFRLKKTIRVPRNERRWREVLLNQECIRGGEILTTFLTKEMVILQGKTEHELDSEELKV